MSEILAEGARLTGGFHLSEDQIAVSRLRGFRGPTSRVSELVRGRGVFRGPIFKRVYVEDPDLGEPYVSARDLVMADVRPTSFLSRKLGSLIEDLRLQEGMILVTCSGMNLGSAIWTRADLDGLVASHDLIRICPNPDQVPPGYLHAFLASRYGRALIRKQIYGGNIKHVEPQHIEALVVPRAGRIEMEANRLVLEASQLRSKARATIQEVQAQLERELRLPDLSRRSVAEYSVRVLHSDRLKMRLDAPYYSAAASTATRAVETTGCGQPLAHVLKRYFKPPMFKRLWVESPEQGRQFVSGNDAYKFQADALRYVSHHTPKFDEFVLEEGTVIFQGAGQIYGLFGQPLLVAGWLVGLFAADDLYRLVPHTVNDGGYLYAFLRTSVGRLLLQRQACGNSIPRVWDPHIRDMTIPWPSQNVREGFGRRVLSAHAALERARLAENDAIERVERAIEDGT